MEQVTRLLGTHLSDPLGWLGQGGAQTWGPQQGSPYIPRPSEPAFLRWNWFLGNVYMLCLPDVKTVPPKMRSV